MTLDETPTAKAIGYAYTYPDIAGDGVHLFAFAPQMPGTLIERR